MPLFDVTTATTSMSLAAFFIRADGYVHFASGLPRMSREAAHVEGSRADGGSAWIKTI